MEGASVARKPRPSPQGRYIRNLPYDRLQPGPGFGSAGSYSLMAS
jgi:hypothetical protein